MTGDEQLYPADIQGTNRVEGVGGSAAESIAHRNRVVSVRKNADGDIVQFRFADGRVVDYREAIELAQAGQVDHANAFRGRDGAYHIRSDADGDPTNNFDNMPEF